MVLKREYLDIEQRKKKKGLTGQEWYSQQSSRAVNQAIGRVIRHRHDYGAIIFCDARFSNANSVRQLPVWVRSHVQVFEKFGESQGGLSRFFKACQNDPTLRDHAKTAATGGAPAPQQAQSFGGGPD